MGGRSVHRHTVACSLIVLLIGAIPAIGSKTECREVTLSVGAIHSLSATQSQDDLLILDYGDRQIVEVDLESGSWRVVDNWVAAAIKPGEPIAIRHAGSHLLLQQQSPSRFIELDLGFGIRPMRPRELTGKAQPTTNRVVEAIFTWEPAKDGSLVACGDIYLGSGDRGDVGNWISGFVRIPIDRPSEFELLVELDLHSLTALSCRLAMPVIALLKSHEYMLILDEKPRIVARASGSKTGRTLDVIPEQFASVPPLPVDPGRDEVPRVYRQIELSSMPVGLFAWEKHLYLLSRSPGEAGTDWWLTRIDPGESAGKEKVLGTIGINSRANHLMLVPGKEYWAVVEKGRVTSFLDQPVHRVLVLPAAEVRSWSKDRQLCGPPEASPR